nr:hypothetical protein Iba_chr06aCG19510 [Ipomoea batatas]
MGLKFRGITDDVVEATPTDASSANFTRSPWEVEAAEGRGGDRSPRRGKSPRVVISHLYDRLQDYSPTSREVLLTTLPPRPTSSQVVSLPVYSAQPSSLPPSASTEGGLVSLNSDDVRNHPCLLTMYCLNFSFWKSTKTYEELGQPAVAVYLFECFRLSEQFQNPIPETPITDFKQMGYLNSSFGHLGPE